MFQEQIKTEIGIKQKNINKLIFVESDDDESEDRQITDKLRQT